MKLNRAKEHKDKFVAACYKQIESLRAIRKKLEQELVTLQAIGAGGDPIANLQELIQSQKVAIGDQYIKIEIATWRWIRELPLQDFLAELCKSEVQYALLPMCVIDSPEQLGLDPLFLENLEQSSQTQNAEGRAYLERMLAEAKYLTWSEYIIYFVVEKLGREIGSADSKLWPAIETLIMMNEAEQVRETHRITFDKDSDLKKTFELVAKFRRFGKRKTQGQIGLAQRVLQKIGFNKTDLAKLMPLDKVTPIDSDKLRKFLLSFKQP